MFYMTEKERLVFIKEIIAKILEENNVGEFKIYLFGSRAKGEQRADSDYDILVVTQKEFNGKEKFNLLRKIRKRIKYLGLGIDILLKSTVEYKAARDCFGSLIYSIRNEIITI